MKFLSTKLVMSQQEITTFLTNWCNQHGVAYNNDWQNDKTRYNARERGFTYAWVEISPTNIDNKVGFNW